ncbi:MAG: hypothetical protein HQL82_00590 [Magnetococcales bacterium]|nr:hypothetical protein [Magnetococcales bacterium]
MRQEPAAAKSQSPTFPFGWLDRLSWTALIIVAILLGVAPITGQPHLIEKLLMVADGTLVRLLDIFDLFLHGTPQILVILKAVRQIRGAGR